MAIASVVQAQRDFSAGQIDETAERREDTKIFRAGMRELRNVRLLNSGAATRRPGRRWIYKSLTGSLSGLVRPAPGEWWWVEIEATKITFRRRFPSATSPQTFTGKPWTGPQVPVLRYEMSGTTLFVCHQAWKPWTFTYNPVTQTWSEAAFAFAVDPNGERREPFRNFNAGQGITFTPSARTGTITATFSGAVLNNPGHVGVRFRYGEQQIEITAVSSATIATATCITQLPPTYVVTFNTVEGLQAGDVIEGVTSNAKGNVLSVDVGLLQATILVTRNWAGFTGSEIVAGPRWKGTVTASVAAGSPGATVLWDEAFCSDYRGWPGSVSVDQQRVVFSRFKQFGPAIIWSATGTLNDFRPGANADDAIFEFVPDSSSVLEVLGGPDEFILTDTGIYYIPISSASPLQPGSIEFKLIAQIGAAPIRPALTADGFVFINASLSRILAVQATGQAARPYVTDDATQYHSDLIKNPVCMAITSSDVTAPERYIYVVNSDGTMAVGRYESRLNGDGWIGWVPWDGEGRIRWVTAGGADVGVTAEYSTSTGLISSVEVLDDTLLLDASINATVTFDPLASNWLTGTEVSLESAGWYRGEITSPTAGTIESQVPSDLVTPTRLGKNFVVVATPFVPHADPGDGRNRQRLRRRRIKTVGVRVIRTQAVEIAGRAWPFWLEDENQEVAPPQRTDVYRARLSGRDFDPSWSLVQELPGALTILEMTTEVTV